MALRMNILDERNTSTSVRQSDFRFYSGENRTLRVQLIESLDNNPVFVPSGATVTFTILATPSNLSKTASIDAVNRSIFSVELNQTETSQMISGNLLCEINDAGNKRIAKTVNAMKKQAKEFT